MKRAIYPGSFNPWHEGHTDVLRKALAVFDEVAIATGYNPQKDSMRDETHRVLSQMQNFLSREEIDRTSISHFPGLLADFVTGLNKGPNGLLIYAVIRGLRNGHDLQYEMNQQYWNEDLGISIPTIYFITDRKFGHISSSAIRAVDEMKGK